MGAGVERANPHLEPAQAQPAVARSELVFAGQPLLVQVNTPSAL